MFTLQFHRRVALFLVGLSLPVEGILIFDLAGRATAFKLTTAWLLLLAAFQFFFKPQPRRRDRKAPWVIGFACSYGIALGHAVLQGFPAASLITPMTAMVSLLVFYFVLTYTVTSKKEMVIFLWGFVLGSALAALPAALGMQEGVNQEGERLEGLAGQVNRLGLNTMLSLPIVLALFLATRSLAGKAVLATSGALAAGGMLASLSRTAFVSSAGAWSLWVYRFRRPGSIKYVIPALAIAVAAMFFAPESVQRRIETMTDPAQRAQDGPIQERLAQFEVSLTAVVQNPVIGIGARRFMDWYHEQSGLPLVHNLVHNAYLRVAVEQGLIGLAAYVGILVIAWRQYTVSWRAARRDRFLKDSELAELGHYATFLQISLFGALIGGMFTHSQDSKPVWVLLALAAVVRHLVGARLEALQAAQGAEERDLLPTHNRPLDVAARSPASVVE